MSQRITPSPQVHRNLGVWVGCSAAVVCMCIGGLYVHRPTTTTSEWYFSSPNYRHITDGCRITLNSLNTNNTTYNDSHKKHAVRRSVQQRLPTLQLHDSVIERQRRSITIDINLSITSTSPESLPTPSSASILDLYKYTYTIGVIIYTWYTTP